MASIWNMKSPIHSNKSIQIHDYNLNTEVEDIEACFGVIPCRKGDGSWHETDPSSEGSSQGEDSGREQKNEDLGPEMSFAKLLDSGAFWYNDSREYKWNRYESCGSEVDPSCPLDISVNPMSIGAERKEALDRACN